MGLEKGGWRVNALWPVIESYRIHCVENYGTGEGRMEG
jgi:hypothetical protein